MRDKHSPVGRKGESILVISFPCLDKRGHYKAAILLRYFERVGLIVRQGEILSSIDVEIRTENNNIEKWAKLIEEIKRDINGMLGTVDILSLAERLNIDPVDAIHEIYGATLDAAIYIGSREFRDIRYLKLRNDIDNDDLENIEAEMSNRRAFKYDRLERMIKYAENTTNCRAQLISQYFDKSQNPCGKCDICLKSGF